MKVYDNGKKLSDLYNNQKTVRTNFLKEYTKYLSKQTIYL